MAGILLGSGQNFVIDRLLDYANDSGLYVGLMINSGTIAENAQLQGGATPSTTDLVEISTYGTVSGYARQLPSTWTKTSATVDPVIEGAQVTFNVSGTWSQVNGYFVAEGEPSGVYDALWAEVFPAGHRGNKYDGDTIKITPKYEQKDDSE